MRTTITLEENLFDALKERAHERGVPFKRVVNDAIRSGLEHERKSKPYKVPSRPMGPPKIDLTKANQIAAALDDEKIIRELKQGR